MLETPHVIVGAAIATKVLNPALSLPLALGSHFILDQILHWNPHTYTETKKLGHPSKKSTIIVIIDSTLALFSGLGIALLTFSDYSKAIIIILACFLSALPDLVKSPFYYLNSKNKMIKKWVDIERKIQFQTDNIFLGLLTQFLIVVAAFWWIFG